MSGGRVAPLARGRSSESAPLRASRSMAARRPTAALTERSGHTGYGTNGATAPRRKRCYSRPAPCSRARPLPSTGNAAWWWSTLGIRQSHYFGRAKTKFQLYLAATVANLTLVAAKAGLTGETGSGPSHGSAQVAGMVNSATAWLGQIWTLSLLVSALLTKFLFPIRGFRPGFRPGF